MPTFHGTPIATSTTIPASYLDNAAVHLARYLQRVGTPESIGFGVRKDADNDGCRIWNQFYRDTILHYLSEAQSEIENFVGYPLQNTWIVGRDQDALDYRFVDYKELRNPLLTRWGMVQAGGIRGEATIQLGAMASHVTDPAVVGPIATTVTDPAEIKVYHPDTEHEIHPAKITLSGGNLTLLIPRVRLVLEALQDTPATGLDYLDLDNFEDTVDVLRVYNDSSTQAVLVAPHSCDGSCASTACGEYSHTACMYVENGRIGRVSLRQATYSAGAWSGAASGYCQRSYGLVRLNYLAGIRNLTLQFEDAIIRLAHTKMPVEPCGCDAAISMWRGDRDVPANVTRERFNCPFGMSNGAWTAFTYARQQMLVRASVLEHGTRPTL